MENNLPVEIAWWQAVIAQQLKEANRSLESEDANALDPSPAPLAPR
jgi:hypothetical protein